jgi:hypothetical protein
VAEKLAGRFVFGGSSEKYERRSFAYPLPDRLRRTANEKVRAHENIPEIGAREKRVDV